VRDIYAPAENINVKPLELCTRRRGTHVLEAVDEPTIRPIAELTHHVLDRDEVFDINRWRIFEAIRCRGRIEVYKMAGTFGGLEVCHQ
jgi:hypothetical protein